MVEDSCPSCGDGDIGEYQSTIDLLFPLIEISLADMSPAVFKQLASLGVGVLHISWSMY